MGTATFIDILLAILLPPLGVFLRYGCEVITWIFLKFLIKRILLATSWSSFPNIYIHKHKNRNLIAGWILDMFGFDAFWVSSWDPLRPLCPHQINYHLSSLLFISSPCKLFLSTLSLSLLYVTYMTMKRDLRSVMFWYSLY